MDENTRDTMFSTGNQEWRTPPWLFKHMQTSLHTVFVLDAAATEENALCGNFYTKEDNALVQNWALEVAKIREHGNLSRGSVWVNPPFGPRETLKWAAKGYETSQNGVGVTMLLPARIDTEFFHRYIAGKAELFIIEGRLHFSNSETGAPFPSIVVNWPPFYSNQFGKLRSALALIKSWWRHVRRLFSSNGASIWSYEIIQQPDGLFKGRRPSTAWRNTE